jgi:hypothetical protein
VLVASLAVLSAALGTAAPPSRNAGFEPKTFALVKARLVVSPEEEIEQGTLVMRDGMIVAAGRSVEVPADAEVIDAAGLVVYAGFIDAANSSLLDPARVPAPTPGRPVDFAQFALAATPPDNRKSLTPDLVAHEALKSDAALIENRRKLGFTSIHLLPTGRIAGGQGSLLSTSGLPLREAVVINRTLPEFV